ncbi:hypothetical protein ACA910_019401 [Epithemia clementina (nom. ined.)]
MELITCLFDYAYGNQVTILLATPNRFLAEKLVILNGTSKIIPTKAAIRDRLDDPHYEQTSTLENSETCMYRWRYGLGWTHESIVQFLQQEFGGAVPKECLEEITSLFGTWGNIRGAILQISKAFPSLASQGTATNPSLGEQSAHF